MFKNAMLIWLGMILLAACGGVAGPASEITFAMTDFAYSPRTVTIRAGEPVMITLENTGLVEHDFVIEKVEAAMVLLQDSGSEAHHAHGQESDFDLHASAQVGTTTVIELTVSEPGTYQFFCSVEGHREAGMIGELIVVAQE